MDSDDKLLILLAKQENESSLHELCEKHYEMVYRLVYRYVRSQPDTKDILQGTSIKAFKAIQKVDFNISTYFLVWICQICIRCFYDYHRKRKKGTRVRPYPFLILNFLFVLMLNLS